MVRQCTTTSHQCRTILFNAVPYPTILGSAGCLGEAGGGGQGCRSHCRAHDFPLLPGGVARKEEVLTLPTRPGQSTAFLHRQQTVMVMFLCKVCPFKCPPTLCSWPCTRHSRGMTGAQQSNLGYCPYFYITLHISTLF